MPMASASLALAHLSLVERVARQLGLRRSHGVLEDCLQEGRIALLGAAERFDATRGVPFPSFAKHAVSNAMKEFFCRQGIVREPVKRVSARAARDERAHPIVLDCLDEIRADACAEEDLFESMQLMRFRAEYESRLGRVPGPERKALSAAMGGKSHAEFAADRGICRETARTLFYRALAMIGAEHLLSQAARLLIGGQDRQLAWTWAPLRLGLRRRPLARVTERRTRAPARQRWVDPRQMALPFEVSL